MKRGPSDAPKLSRRVIKQVERLSLSDVLFFRQWPKRRHRVRSAYTVELQAGEALCGSWEPLAPGESRFVAVRREENGTRQYRFFATRRRIVANPDEETAADLFQAASRDRPRLEPLRPPGEVVPFPVSSPALRAILDGDRKFFERHPERNYRVRLTGQAELIDAIREGWTLRPVLPGMRWATVVRRVRPGLRTRGFCQVVDFIDFDAPEEICRDLYKRVVRGRDEAVIARLRDRSGE